MASFPRRRKSGNQPKAKTGNISRFTRFKSIGRRKIDADGNPVRARGIYLLPNAFTTAALFCGFYAIVQAMNLRFELAAWAIFVAMVLDGLDGRVARLTNTQSEFGAQYDSLSDMVSFGAAPALVIYEWSLRTLPGKWGWIAAFVYCSCAALRLARFNTNIEVVDKRFFQGLPSPAAAAMVAGFILIVTDLGYSPILLRWFAFGITLFAGLSMVTNVPFYSFKEVNLRKSVPFIVVFLIVLGLALVSIDPPKVLTAIFVLYGLSGYGVFLWRLAKGKPVSIVQTDDDLLDPSERR
ncbi:CDP-diacylglycerol--serine O-phosphatidyltransferase [Massilia sp. TSP1-1-2]|uniref:CDP-diacylglycerol--serine O-phosphatidyltransferase n=1 Tax=unclassified Massilia TaxID=2609279 RepID=UPI003CF052CC